MGEEKNGKGITIKQQAWDHAPHWGEKEKKLANENLTPPQTTIGLASLANIFLL